mmetsp:Transcript_58445/g.103918  ORF Transcript_58445/g.103918 Transcript_58445/m.103918 type:complete len:263 (+) Transcript_58445:2-790(+)
MGGPGDAGTIFNGPFGPALDARLKMPLGLALDQLGQRLYVADTADPAVRVIDLASGLLSIAATRPGYYDHKLSPNDMGPTGLVVGKASVPGFRIESIYHDPPAGGPDIFGQYFYFNSNLGYKAGPQPISGIHRARQYRRGLLLWAGYLKFYGERYGIGPTRQSEPTLDNTGIRYPAPVSEIDQFEVNDTILVDGLLSEGEEAGQTLYMAEGNNHVVRKVDLTFPVKSVCGDPNITMLRPDLWDWVPYEVGGKYVPPAPPPGR